MVKTYPEMNKKIIRLLRIGDNQVDQYAAQRIEELEFKLTKIQRILKEPAPFGAVEEQLDQIKEIVDQSKEDK